MRDIFADDAYTDEYKALTNKIRQVLEPIFEEHQALGYSRKGVGMAVVNVVHAMAPMSDGEPLKYEGKL